MSFTAVRCETFSFKRPDNRQPTMHTTFFYKKNVTIERNKVKRWDEREILYTLLSGHTWRIRFLLPLPRIPQLARRNDNCLLKRSVSKEVYQRPPSNREFKKTDTNYTISNT